MESIIAENAKREFRHCYKIGNSGETFAFDDMPIELQEYILKMLPMNIEEELPIISYFPNRDYFFLITTRRFFLQENGKKRSIPLSRVLGSTLYYTFERLEIVGSGKHHVARFRLEISWLFHFQKYLHAFIDLTGYSGMHAVFASLYRNSRLGRQQNPRKN